MSRTFRISGIALTLAILFRLSRDVSRAWGNEEAPGYTVALGVVTLLFLIRAVATEYGRKELPDTQKDILWGLSLGTFATMLSRLAE